MRKIHFRCIKFYVPEDGYQLNMAKILQAKQNTNRDDSDSRQYKNKFITFSSSFLTLQSANGNGSAQNGKIQSEKLARLRNYGEPFDIFLAFQNGLEVQCGASTSASIRQLQTNLSEYLIYLFEEQ